MFMLKQPHYLVESHVLIKFIEHAEHVRHPRSAKNSKELKIKAACFSKDNCLLTEHS